MGGMVNIGCEVSPPESIYNISGAQAMAMNDNKLSRGQPPAITCHYETGDSYPDLTVDPPDPLHALSDSDISRVTGSSRWNSQAVSVMDSNAADSETNLNATADPHSSSVADLTNASSLYSKFAGAYSYKTVVQKERIVRSAGNSPICKRAMTRRPAESSQERNGGVGGGDDLRDTSVDDNACAITVERKQ